MRQRFVRPLTPEERTGLEELHQRGRTHDERRRAQFILFSAAGHDLLHSAQLVGMSRKTAGRTLRVFEAGGVAALRTVPRPGRVPALGPAARREVAEVLRQSPRQQGYATNNWTGPLLREYLRRTYQVTLSVDQIQRIMHQLGFRRVRARRKLAKGDA
ncbi:MAG TPA: helix-turn-helix domain-containing protein [Bryobacteraceae bacterium]